MSKAVHFAYKDRILTDKGPSGGPKGEERVSKRYYFWRGVCRGIVQGAAVGLLLLWLAWRSN